MKYIFSDKTEVSFSFVHNKNLCNRITIHTKENSFTLMASRMFKNSHYKDIVKFLNMTERKTIDYGVEYILLIDDFAIRIGKNYDYIRLTVKNDEDIYCVSNYEFEDQDQAIYLLNKISEKIKEYFISNS